MKAQYGKFEYLEGWLADNHISMDALERYLHLEGYPLIWRNRGKYPLGIKDVAKPEITSLKLVTILLEEKDWKRLAELGVYPKPDELE